MAENKQNTKPTEPHFDKEVNEVLERYLGAPREVDEEEERQANLALLRNSYQMHEQSKAEMIRVRSTKKDKYGNRIYSDASIKKTLALMERAQDDIKEKYLQLGGNPEDLEEIRKSKKRIDRSGILKAIEKANKEDGIKSYVSTSNKSLNVNSDEDKPFPTAKGSYTDFKSREIFVPETSKTYKVPKQLLETEQSEQVENKKNIEERKNKMEAENLKQTVAQIKSEVASSALDGIVVRENNGNSPYDTVNLPSKGECYKSKIKEVNVEYLTAYDENLILSPNLYRKGTFLDHILNNKVKGINPDDLVQGDRDAIIIWLRASGYGNEYPVSVTDDKTGEEFDTVVDLSKLKFRKFTLKGDENGYFDFKLPVTGDEIKFKFLTNKDTKKLQEMQNEEDKQYRVSLYNESVRRLRNAVEDNDLIDEDSYQKLMGAIATLEEEGEAVFSTIPEAEFSHDMTNRLILSTVSINGNKDRNFIANYILKLNVRDAKAYREYLINNEPGIDYNIKVERPESLGGGFMTTFLRLDQFIFATEV